MTNSFEAPAHQLTGPRIKTALHCHTVNSDGGLSPRETAEQYRAEGFGALCITDHRHVTVLDEYALDGLVCLPGTENGGWPDIIGVGVHSPVDPELPLAERARQLADQGGFTIAAHPTYCEAVPESYLDCDHLMALEILNAYCDSAYANGLATELWDMVLGRGKRVWGVAADDAHLNPRKRHYSAAGKAWIEAFSSTATAEDLLEALKAGAFFSTQGPVFEQIAVEDRTMRVTTSPVTQVRWRTFGKVGYVHHAPSGSRIESSELPEWFRPQALCAGGAGGRGRSASVVESGVRRRQRRGRRMTGRLLPHISQGSAWTVVGRQTRGRARRHQPHHRRRRQSTQASRSATGLRKHLADHRR